ncbi:MAG: GNAT family N-acetyltransferase [Bacteroidota bacterium]
MALTDLASHAAAVRRFNRFYTKQIGLLTEKLLESPFSLTEARVIYELAQHEETTAAELGRELALDPGYLSRILGDFIKRGLIAKQPSATDRRRSLLALTAKGQAAFAGLNAASHREIETMLRALPAHKQSQLIQAMGAIETILGGRPENGVPYLLRPPRPGDLGWIVQRHGALYAREYGWDEKFEALVAGIVAEYVQNHDPKRERCWIAERDGENVGSVMLVKKTETMAKLRLLLVEPQARGLGIGARLVDECVRFARQAGYTGITLWTNSILLAARRIYEKAGFRLVKSEPSREYGQDLVWETWEKELE